MNKILSVILAFASVLILNSFGLVGHSLAMSMPTHEMNGMNHSTNSSMNCATLCRTAVLSKEELFSHVIKDDTDTPQTPYYIQLQAQQSHHVDIKGKLYAPT